MDQIELDENDDEDKHTANDDTNIIKLAQETHAVSVALQATDTMFFGLANAN